MSKNRTVKRTSKLNTKMVVAADRAQKRAVESAYKIRRKSAREKQPRFL